MPTQQPSVVSASAHVVGATEPASSPPLLLPPSAPELLPLPLPLLDPLLLPELPPEELPLLLADPPELLPLLLAEPPELLPLLLPELLPEPLPELLEPLPDPLPDADASPTNNDESLTPPQPTPAIAASAITVDAAPRLLNDDPLSVSDIIDALRTRSICATEQQCERRSKPRRVSHRIALASSRISCGGKIAPRSPVSTQVMLNVSARTTLRNLTAAAATLSALVACGPSVTTGQTQGGGGTPVVSNCAADTTYTSLQASLDARKTQFLGPNVQNLVPINTRLYWYDTTNFAPVLNGYTDGGSILAYTFSVGDSIDDANWEGSNNLIVTAQSDGETVTYSAYDPSQASSQIGTMSIAAPSGASYWAYAVDGTTVYLVTLDANQHNALIKWVPAAGPTTTTVTTLESAGAQVGEFWEFGVSANTMVFVESGAIWTLDIAANKATPLNNTTQVESDSVVDFEPDGVMFSTDTALMFYSYAASSLTNLTNEINANGYQIDSCNPGASNYSTDFARWGNYVIYIGEDDGVFAYDMTSNVIAPVLLPPEGTSVNVQYRYPVALTNGKLFVTGLTSTDGATGADGPTYEVDLSTFLH